MDVGSARRTHLYDPSTNKMTLNSPNLVSHTARESVIHQVLRSPIALSFAGDAMQEPLLSLYA